MNQLQPVEHPALMHPNRTIGATLNPLPAHIAIIPDGNSRWARAHGRLPVDGYKAGLRVLENIVEYADSVGVQYLTAYFASRDNIMKRGAAWSRVFFEFALSTIKQYFNKSAIDRYQVKIIGDLSSVPDFVRHEFEQLVERTKNNTGLVFTIAIAYTGKFEILHAVNTLIKSRVRDGIDMPVSAEELAAHMDLHGIPPPELLIRSSGQLRLSGFLLWHLEYTELAFPQEFWPDFTVERFKELLMDYQLRTRTFGSERYVQHA
ncbi:MAG: di-trans,poly-cis-decaprenylcistransferase [Holosporales bacterium]|jgi:undecaprenyl diphosphate synthase|nr:di-trans,poly-cis-decaprenylcistransferase [Holosporales bacterium]